MDNQLIEIMRISNLKMVYCYLIDAKDSKCLAIEIVYGNKKLSLDYKSEYFSYFLNKIKEVYNKEKDKHNITFLGDFSKIVIESYKLSINKDGSYTDKNIYPFNTMNYQTNLFIPYVKQALELILKTVYTDKILNTNITGYRNKYVATYTVDDLKHIVSLYLNKTKSNELQFKIGGIESEGIIAIGNVLVNDEYVTTKWNIDNRYVSGKIYSEIENSFIEEEIIYNHITVYYDRIDNEVSSDILNYINNILNTVCGIKLNNCIKTSNSTYLLKEESTSNNLINKYYCHVVINDNIINIKLKNIEGYMEYEDLFIPTIISENIYNIVNLGEYKLVQECSNNKYKYYILKDNELFDIDISDYDSVNEIKNRGNNNELVRRI